MEKVPTHSPIGITRSAWGRVDDKEVFLFRITNKNGMRMSVTNYGAIAQGLEAPDRRGGFANLLLRYDRLDDYITDPYYIGALVGRYAGRIAGGVFSITGKEYQVTKTKGGYHHHGGKEGFGKKVWSADPFSAAGVAGVRFCYTSSDGEEGFPGTLRTEALYTLNDDNEWGVDISAHTDKATVLNLTQHAYFNLSGYSDRSVLDHLLQIPAIDFLPVSDQIIPRGTVERVSDSPFDFLSPRRIGDRIGDDHEQLLLGDGYDHSWVLGNEGALRQAARLSDPGSGRVLDVLTTEPAIHFYSGNYLGTLETAGNFDRRTGLCLETQHFSDSPNQLAFPSTVLNPGEMFRSRTVFRFSVEKV